jgi:orotate phosphoribosyltransferase
VLVGRKLRDGDRVLIVEDVTTAGTSIRETVPVLRAAADIALAGLVVSVDRRERAGSEEMKSALDQLADEFSMPVASIVDLDDILDHLGTSLPREDRDRIDAYRSAHGVPPRS